MAKMARIIFFCLLWSSTALDSEPETHHHNNSSYISTSRRLNVSPAHIGPSKNNTSSGHSKQASRFWKEMVPFTLSSDVPRAGKKTLYFVHIPKTAGSSMERVMQTLCEQRKPLCLRRFMGSELIKKQGKYKVDLIQSFPENEVCPKHKGDIVFGHMPFDVNYVKDTLLNKRVAPTPVLPQMSMMKGGVDTIFPIIMLREPVARVVSFANFLNIAQELFEKHPERLTCNQQTSMINGVPGSGGGCGVGVTSQKKLWSSFVMFEGSCNHDEVAAVQEGTRRLEEMFYFVGVAEDFIGSMYILQRMFGWGTETMRTSFEKSMKQFCDGICMKRYQMKDLKTSTVERITANEYRCDGKLWSHAKSMLEERLSAMDPEDIKQYQAFERMAKVQDKKRDAAIKLATQKTTFKNTKGVLKMTSLSLESLSSKEGGQVMDVSSALRLASASGMLTNGKSPTAGSTGSTGSTAAVDYSSNSMVNQAIMDSIKTNAKANPTTYSSTSSSTANHYGVCGANAMLEMFHDTRKGDVCRIRDGSKEFYCPLGCRIATITASVLCTENTPKQEPCRRRGVKGESRKKF